VCIEDWFSRGEDIRLPYEIVIPPKSLRVNIPFEIVDDHRAEGNETVSVYMVSIPHAHCHISSSPVALNIADNGDSKFLSACK